MPRGRRYDAKDRLVAVVAADMTSAIATAEAMGIPRSTLRHWLDDPELVPYRQNARESLAEEVLVVARLAWEKLADALRAGRVEPRDLVIAAGMSLDKSQLVSGKATARTESRDITRDDHESALLADVIRSALAEVGVPEEATAGDAEGAAVGRAET